MSVTHPSFGLSAGCAGPPTGACLLCPFSIVGVLKTSIDARSERLELYGKRRAALEPVASRLPVDVRRADVGSGSGFRQGAVSYRRFAGLIANRLRMIVICRRLKLLKLALCLVKWSRAGSIEM